MPSQSLKSNDLRNLALWRPGYLFLLLVAIGGGTAAVRTYEASKHFVEGSVQVETDGTSGAIEDGELVLKLPLKVFNGTDSTITSVDMWVDAYACPRLMSPQGDCTRLHSSEQRVALHVAAGSSSSDNAEIRADLPKDVAGDFIRVKRRMIGITSDVEDAERQFLEQYDK